MADFESIRQAVINSKVAQVKAQVQAALTAGTTAQAILDGALTAPKPTVTPET